MAEKPQAQAARYHRFKQLLHKIATRLGEADVRSLVFNQDLPGELKYALGVDVLQKLEREGLFSDRNIHPLAELLRAIERHDLVNNYVQEYIQEFELPLTMAEKPQTARYHRFKQLLHKIATRLGEADVRSLVFNQDLPGELKDALGVDVLQKLEREGLFSDRNIHPLAELLRAIERHDLVDNYVQEYIQKFEEEEENDGN